MKCHRTETERYLATAMGKSFIPPEKYPGTTLHHQESGSTLTIKFENGKMIHELAEDGFVASYPARYQVGGGMLGSTFLVQVKNYLFESPVSWFNGYGWDLSPGYADRKVVDFDRAANGTCLYCHASGARFSDPDERHLVSTNLQSITCDRCHGPGEDHVRHPRASNIINPAKLSGAARDSICEQCHLEGSVRVPNPGKHWTDFRVGDDAESTFATYVLRGANSQEVAPASEVEQLAQSRCARASHGKLWCGTCHNPHHAPAPRQQQIKAICMSCHQKLSPTAHRAGLTECTSCHMPTTKVTTITHAAHTDHRILRRPASAADPGAAQEKLSPWREPPQVFQQRDLGIAELMLSPGNPGLEKEGVGRLLSLGSDAVSKDPSIAFQLEAYYAQAGDIPKALEFGRISVQSDPQSASAAMSYAMVMEQSGDAAGSERQFLRAIALDPSLKDAYGRLGLLDANQGRIRDARDILDRYLQWNPDEILFHAIKKRRLAQPASRPAP